MLTDTVVGGNKNMMEMVVVIVLVRATTMLMLALMPTGTAVGGNKNQMRSFVDSHSDSDWPVVQANMFATTTSTG